MNYKEIKKLIDKYKSEGKTLPCMAENEHGENVIISEGKLDGQHFIQTEVAQNNNYVRYNVYWEDGITEEYFE